MVMGSDPTEAKARVQLTGQGPVAAVDAGDVGARVLRVNNGLEHP